MDDLNLFSDEVSDLDGVMSPLVDITFLIIAALFVGYIVFYDLTKNQIPKPIEIPTDEFFELGRASFSDSARHKMTKLLTDTLRQIYYQLTSNDSLLYKKLKYIQVIGHADAVPLKNTMIFRSNEELSYLRASSVYEIIKQINRENGWFHDSLIIVSGMGDRKLKIKTLGSEPRNRRIELNFVFKQLEHE